LLQGAAGRLVSVSALVRGGKQAVVARFARQLEGSRRSYPCTIIFASEFHWAVLECTQEYAWGQWVRTVDYRTDMTDVPFPARVVERQYDQDGRLGQEDFFDFQRPDLTALPPEGFRLTHYGLPEVSPMSGFRNWLLVINIAVVVGALTLLGYRRAVRRRLRRVPRHP
jgi:hypothetical protein